MSLSRARISTKIFCAFLAMAGMMGALGLYGVWVLGEAGNIVADTYDRPLMAINFARAAAQDFTEMRLDVARRDAAPEAEHAQYDQDIAKLAVNFTADLQVASDRSLGAEERALIVRIEANAVAWNELRLEDDPGAAQERLALAQEIGEDFDRLVEFSADHGFVERRKGISAITQFENDLIAASALALFFAAVIAFLLSRRIIRPLTQAAHVADRIAGGELDTSIPAGGADETGILLRSMAVMRDNIRAMMEREQAQARSAEVRLIDALESSHEGIALVDAEGRVVMANTQMAAFFPEMAPGLSSGADFVELFGAASAEFELGEMLLPDGRWVRASRSPTRAGGFILFVSDFSAVKERERRITEAQQAAEAASRAKSSFLANMSHELRTPLNAVIGFSEIMANEMFGALGHKSYGQYANAILSSGRHLLEIINSVLDLAKSEADKLEIMSEPVELGRVLGDCLVMIGEQCAKAGLMLESCPLDQPVIVMGETAKLRQIFLNLLSNAIKFTEPGGRVALAIEQRAAGHVAVSVSDTGIGMSAADLEIALAPFGQVDSRLSRRFDGTGLGLPLATVLVELHGGKLTIDSTPGRGTTVTVVFPPLPAAIAAQLHHLAAAS